MKLLRIAPLAFLIAVGLAGCGKAKAKTAAEKALDEAEAAATAFCACKPEDADCIKKATASGEAADKILQKETLTAEISKRMAAITVKVGKCAAGEAPPADEPKANADGDKLLADMATLRDAACKCTDQACFEAAVKEGDGFEDRFKALGAMPAEFGDKVEAIKKEVTDCAAKIGGGNAPTPPASDSAAVDAVIAEFATLVDEVCKCPDMACANTSMEKGEALEDKLKAAVGDTTPADVEAKLSELEGKAKACVEKLQP